jgi:hypothetical protein
VSQSPEAVAGVAQKFREWNKKYFTDIIEPFERGAVRKVLAKDGTGFYRTLDEDVAKTFWQSADAADQIQRIAQTQPKLMADIQAVALDELAFAATAGRNKDLSLTGIQKWKAAHENALSRLPELKKIADDVETALAQVEADFETGTQQLGAARLDARQRLRNERRGLARQRQEIGRQGNQQIQGLNQQSAALTDQSAQNRQQLQKAMEPLLQRMGLLHERKLAVEDAQLARRVKALSEGSKNAGSVIREAVENPRLMKRLWRQAEPYKDARAALRRHVWEGLTGLEGAKIKQYMADHAESLSVVLSKKHLDDLKIIADGKEMADFAPVEHQGKPIKSDLISTIQETIGVNPQQISSRYLAVVRGRSQKAVEGFDSLARWIGAKSTRGMDQLMDAALYEPEVAESLVDSLLLQRNQGIPDEVKALAAQKFPGRPVRQRAFVTGTGPMTEKFATNRLRGWLWRLGITAPLEEREKQSNG